VFAFLLKTSRRRNNLLEFYLPKPLGVRLAPYGLWAIYVLDLGRYGKAALLSQLVIGVPHQLKTTISTFGLLLLWLTLLGFFDCCTLFSGGPGGTPVLPPRAAEWCVRLAVTGAARALPFPDRGFKKRGWQRTKTFALGEGSLARAQ
jgi:hypothetical protein